MKKYLFLCRALDENKKPDCKEFDWFESEWDDVTLAAEEYAEYCYDGSAGEWTPSFVQIMVDNKITNFEIQTEPKLEYMAYEIEGDFNVQD